jgi:NTP pyrophosphatase (non-canonical NTP hydrolase)
MTSEKTITDYLGRYDQFVDDLLVSKRDTSHFIVAVCEEAGELAGKLKRLNRGDYFNGCSVAAAHDAFSQDVVKELGDIMYYLVATAHTVGFNLDDILYLNMEKLLARKAKGTIKGSGDTR